jgi:Mg-chelatase subunit ChlD
MSKLDVLKHAVKTTAFSLEEKDKFGLVAFNEKAHTLIELEEMNDKNKEKVSNILDQMMEHGATNIWAGLSTAMDILLS